MKEKQAKLPGPDGPIAMECNPARVVIAVAWLPIPATKKRRNSVVHAYEGRERA
ncbi:MAG TPA: hypothetical protein VNO32_59090 [Candidatus Acidoferrum sp.]|nr:hypothetical protein [Candidatus Acidoferrum sp.]